jgi:DNA ligase 1
MKPMLAALCEDIMKLRYPVIASPKLDGIRALVLNGQLVSRTLKPIPNRHVQKLFAGLPEGTDGELIMGAANDDPYRRTVSAVMSEDGEPDVTYFVFDNFLAKGGFNYRYLSVCELKLKQRKNINVVLHEMVYDVEELNVFESKCIELGFEGAMIRDPNGPYKFGRSTAKEGYLLKLKRYQDSDAKIIGTYELMHNGNEAVTNALGRTERSSHKDNKTGLDSLGGFELRDIHTEVEFRCGTGLTQNDRETLWDTREELIGKIIKYKYFPTGSKEKPRHPVFLGFRSKLDL